MCKGAKARGSFPALKANPVKSCIIRQVGKSGREGEKGGLGPYYREWDDVNLGELSGSDQAEKGRTVSGMGSRTQPPNLGHPALRYAGPLLEDRTPKASCFSGLVKPQPPFPIPQPRHLDNREKGCRKKGANSFQTEHMDPLPWAAPKDAVHIFNADPA